LDSRLADSHGPAHGFDCDFFDASSEFVVLNLTVVMVVAGVDHGHLFWNEMFDDILGSEWGQHVLILISG
jgi:hypothetical protein